MVKSPIRLILVVSIAFVCYAVTAFLHLTFWADLTAPVFDFLAAAMIFHAILTSKNKKFRLNFIMVGAAIVSWGMADTLWFVLSHLYQTDPGDSALVNVLYYLTNSFLVISLLLYAYYRLKKWDVAQLLLDGSVFAFSLLWLLWTLMYKKSLERVSALLDYGVMNTLSIGMDVFMLVVIGIWYLSIRKGRVPLFLRFLVGGVALYAMVDLGYFHMYTNNLYVPDSFVDVLYLGSLAVMAISVKAYYTKYPSEYTEANPNTNIGNTHKGLLLLLCPALIAVFGTLDASDIALYAIIILFHEGTSSYIQSSIANRERLGLEIDTNKKLEQLVSEKTCDLNALNTELIQRNEDLQYALLHDSLTKLHNRAYFLEKLDAAILAAKGKHEVALILWNVDNLKGINDTYGHHTGDQILITHALRVQHALEGICDIARLGGDEFAFFLEGSLVLEDAVGVAERVVNTCKDPYMIDGYTFDITVGMGISVYPHCAEDRSILLRNADVAMHYAKETKTENHIAAYRDIDTAMNRRYRIGNYLKTIDYQNDLKLHYQPQFRMADRRLIGMEALLRWDCPDIGPVSPAEFIPIAEDENLIIPMGNWVIENAVEQIAKWNRAYHTNLRMGINFSPKQFDQASTYTVLAEAVKRHRAMFRWIDIEITESVALDHENSAANIKQYFRNKQMSVSIDDFGTGYSSLGYLTILAFNRLKIAKPLIDKITTDESSRKIVTSIIMLAKSLDLHTIAEGVETKAQFDRLFKLGCDQVQGYYLGRPVPADLFEERFLRQETP